jgi:hypothetical protein
MNLLKLFMISIFGVQALKPISSDGLRSMCELTRTWAMNQVIEQVYKGVVMQASRGLSAYHWTNKLDHTNTCTHFSEEQGKMVKDQLVHLFPGATVIYNWPRQNDFDVFW